LTITLKTSRSVSVVVVDSQSDGMRFLLCSGQWQGSFADVGAGAGTVTALAEGYSLTADYPPAS
jgi:hypothetical protein